MRIIPLLRQVASALGAAHRNNIVHRDLKPQNIMIAQSDGQEIAKLVDFGIAKTFDEATQLTSSGSTMGTPQYMAPEQAAGQPVDGRSDIYSLGIVMYEMLSGDVPFNDKSVTAIIIKHMKEAPQPPSLKNPAARIPEALEATVLKCLEKDPANRFQTAEEFTAALQAAAHMIHGVAEVLPGQAAILENQPTILANQGAIPAALTASVAEPAAARKSEAVPSTPATVRMSSDTRATAVRPAAAQLAERPVASKPTTASNIGVVAALVAAIVVALGGALYYVVRSGNSAPASVSSEIPAATPAGANSEPPPAVPAGAASAVPASAVPQNETSAPKPTPPPATAITAAVSPVDSGSESGRARADNSQNQAPRPSAAAAVSRDPRAAGSASASSANIAAQATQASQFPENPAVYFHCSGPSEICSALRTAVDEAMENGGLSAVRQAARADVDVAATVEGVQETVTNQFQTTFAVRTYAIDVIAETTRTSEAVSMPPPSNLSFDPQFGSARIAERARLVAADIVDRVKTFAKKKRGG
jgi:serine/threonine-protein kinase